MDVQLNDQETMVKQVLNRRRNASCACLIGVFALPMLGQMLGCEVDSYFDPSRTGRFQHTPTTIPILDRIDVIEQEDDAWGEVTEVQPDDLKPSDLRYILSPGDFLSVEVYELYAPGNWTVDTGVIDASGMFRIRELGDIVAAGKTVEQLEQDIVDQLAAFVTNPQANVTLEQGSAFTYTIYGFVANSGMFTLRDPDLRLLDALAIVGGVPLTTENIYVIREVPLSEDVEPVYERDRSDVERQQRQREEQPVDVDELIEDLRDDGDAQPGALDDTSGDRHARLVDVDDLAPVRVAAEPPEDLDEIRQNAAARAQANQQHDDSYIFVEERNEWVRTRSRQQQPRSSRGNGSQNAGRGDGEQLILERIIKIPWQRLSRGDSSYNIVVRPDDRIYVEGPTPGLVYISGEIARPGVYDMPQNRGRLTLSRLVAAAGDLGPTAMPDRVDLTRIVGDGREATIRVNLAAIRRRTEPDLYLKPNDHVVIGTSWIATPLAVIRNGFRATYGFGFLLDRNFGNDVFGAPPSSRFEN